jgi:hypothetical protein
MMSLDDILGFLKGKNKPQLAQIIAFSLGPALIFIISAFLIFGSSMSFDKPVAISELKTALTEKGDRIPRRGVVIITDLGKSDLTIPLGNSSTVWSSLDEGSVHANTLSGKLKLDAGQLHTKTPLADGAVTLVADGDLGQDIYVSGVKESIEDWRLTTRESRSALSGVSAVGLLAFGIAFALGTARVEPDEEDTREKGAEPNKE